MGGYKCEYQCPSCGTALELRMRVTQTKRKCPHCGTPITPEEIDRQGEARSEEIWRRHDEEAERRKKEAQRRKKEEEKQEAEQAKGVAVRCGYLVVLGVAIWAVATKQWACLITLVSFVVLDVCVAIIIKAAKPSGANQGGDEDDEE
jgi:hypothetical protein